MSSGAGARADYPYTAKKGARALAVLLVVVAVIQGRGGRALRNQIQDFVRCVHRPAYGDLGFEPDDLDGGRLLHLVRSSSLGEPGAKFWLGRRGKQAAWRKLGPTTTRYQARRLSHA